MDCFCAVVWVVIRSWSPVLTSRGQCTAVEVLAWQPSLLGLSTSAETSFVLRIRIIEVGFDKRDSTDVTDKVYETMFAGPTLLISVQLVNMFDLRVYVPVCVRVHVHPCVCAGVRVGLRACSVHVPVCFRMRACACVCVCVGGEGALGCSAYVLHKYAPYAQLPSRNLRTQSNR